MITDEGIDYKQVSETSVEYCTHQLGAWRKRNLMCSLDEYLVRRIAQLLISSGELHPKEKIIEAEMEIEKLKVLVGFLSKKVDWTTIKNNPPMSGREKQTLDDFLKAQSNDK